METTKKVFDEFFECADKVIMQDDPLLTIELYKVFSLDEYDDLRSVYEAYLDNDTKYSAKHQLEGYMRSKYTKITRFVAMVKQKYPKPEKQNSLSDYDSYLNDDVKGYI